jgi:hypothetical protein
LAVLLRTSEGPAPPEDLETSVCLFQLPRHLRSEWWARLEQAAADLEKGGIPGFETFVGQVVQFLDFKDLSLPEGTRCTVVVSNPGQRSVNWRSEAHGPGGLLSNLAPSVPQRGGEEPRWPCLWGAINLGDEATSVVLINLPCRQLEAELCRRIPDQTAAASVGELSGQFLRSCPDYPPVRLILGPGEGYRLPRGGLISDAYLADKQEPDVLMLISRESSTSP